MMLNFRPIALLLVLVCVTVCSLFYLQRPFFLNFCLVDEEIFSRKRCQRAAGSNKEKREEEEEEEEAKKGEREIKARRETRERALFSTKLLERERVREFVRRRAHTRNASKI